MYHWVLRTDSSRLISVAPVSRTTALMHFLTPCLTYHCALQKDSSRTSVRLVSRITEPLIFLEINST